MYMTRVYTGLLITYASTEPRQGNHRGVLWQGSLARRHQPVVDGMHSACAPWSL
jgi:hypothetical protein